MMRLLKLYLELGHLLMYKQWHAPKHGEFFFEKMMRAHFKVFILSLKIYENILKFNFLMVVVVVVGVGECIRHIDCLCKYNEAVIYRCKGVVIL